MASKRVEKLLKKQNFSYEIRDFDRDFIDTEDSRELLDIPMRNIAKTLVYGAPIGAFMIILSGDALIDSAKYKKKFKVEQVRMDAEDLMDYTGNEPGAVSPLAVPNKRVKIYLDISLKRFMEEYVYVSGGTMNSAIGIKAKDLFAVSGAREWVDICMNWQT